MASSNAHHATGFAAGVIAAALVLHNGGGHGGLVYASVLLSFVAGVAGSTAPDWLEVAWWSRKRRLWIAHRTLTHWGIGWLALLGLSYHALGDSIYAAAAFGFACGGVMHLLADWPNPLGVPWIGARHSLNLWNSGHCDLIVVAASWAAAWFVGRHAGLAGMHGLEMLRHLRL